MGTNHTSNSDIKGEPSKSCARDQDPNLMSKDR